jgi:carbon monoxide dehydrogenase subunit G
MKSVAVGVRIDAPARRVWEVCSDIAHAADTIPDITKIEFLGESRQGVGTRWRETRLMSGREVTEVLEIAEWHPPESYVVVARHHGHEFRAVVRVASDGTWARLEYDFGARPLTFVGRVAGALLGPLTRGSLVRALTAELAAIKRRCEARD